MQAAAVVAVEAAAAAGKPALPSLQMEQDAAGVTRRLSCRRPVKHSTGALFSNDRIAPILHRAR